MNSPEPQGDQLVRSRLAARLGWTDGQLQTAAIGLTLVALTTALGVPPVLDRQPLGPVAQATQQPPPEAAIPPPEPVAAEPPTVPGVGAPPALLPALPPDVPPAGQLPVALPPPTALELPPFEPGTAPTTDPTFVPPPQPENPPPADVPGDPALTVAEGGWYTAEPGPLATVGTAPDRLPIATRATRTTRISLVRLTGSPSGTTLTLSLAEETGAQQLEDRAALQACPVLDAGWKAAPAQPIAEAPPFDTADCSPGMRMEGSWTFDLSRYPDPRGANGFALVPVEAPDRPAFQVTFHNAGGAA